MEGGREGGREEGKKGRRGYERERDEGYIFERKKKKEKNGINGGRDFVRRERNIISLILVASQGLVAALYNPTGPTRGRHARG